MYVLALSDYKQPAAAAGYKPAPQLGRQFVTELQLITIVCLSQFIPITIHLDFIFHYYTDF